METITGTVRYIKLGMGFWGIETPTGRKLRPLELPADCQVAGRKIKGTIQLLPDVATAEMWGEVCAFTLAE